jgi:hypothetical protein
MLACICGLMPSGAARVRVWDDEVPAYDMGDIAAQWFTDFLALNDQGLPKANAPKYRLVRFDPEHRRLSDRKWTGQAEALNQFSDGFAVLVLGEASLDGLNTRLQAQGHVPVDVRRFRPNIVLDGLPEHDEDRVGPLQIETAEGPALLTPVKPCPRCPIPNIDPDTAHSSPEVNDTLQTYRQDARVKGALTFGMNSIVTAGVDHVLRVDCRSAPATASIELATAPGAHCQPMISRPRSAAQRCTKWR